MKPDVHYAKAAVRILSFLLTICLLQSADARVEQLSIFRVAEMGVGFYRGEVLEVSRETAVIRVVRTVKGPQIERLVVWTGHPFRTPFVGPPPVMTPGEDVFVCVYRFEDDMGRIESASSKWPRVASIHRDHLPASASEAEWVFSKLLSVQGTSEPETAFRALRELLQADDPHIRKVGLEAVEFLSWSYGPENAERLAPWLRDDQKGRALLMLSALLPEIIATWDTRSPWQRGILRRVCGTDEGLAMPWLAGALVEMASHANWPVMRFVPRDISAWMSTHGERYAVKTPPAAILDYQRWYQHLDLLEAWGEIVRAQLAVARRPELENRLRAEDPLVRAAARGEWVIIFGEEPDGFDWIGAD